VKTSDVRASVSTTRWPGRLILLCFVLHCATASAETWDIQTVDSEGDVGQYTSLALDASGFPRISYYDVTNGDLRYAYRDADEWRIQTVDSEGYVGSWTSLALDMEGFPHIAYHGSGGLKYAYQDSSGWHGHLLENAGDGVGASLVLDSGGFPHISHMGYGAGGMYSYEDSSGWTHEYVPAICYPEFGIDLALDAAGVPHVTYVSYAGTDWLMRHAWKPGGSWQTEIVEYNYTAGAGSSLLIDASGVLHVTHVLVGGSWDVKYAFKDASGWHSQIVDQIDYSMLQWVTSLVLDSEGNPHVCFKRDGCDLAIRHWNGSSWVLEIVDSEGNVGTHPSMALDASDRPHISYYDATHRNLKYARFFLGDVALTGHLQDGQLLLTWEPVGGASAYWVFGNAQVAWFEPDLSPPTYVNRVAVVPGGTTSWSSPNGIADPAINWTYLLSAIGESNVELARSNRVGERDFDLEIP